jgi:hypothetical protein
MMPCVFYTVHIEMRSMDLLVEPQNQCRRFPDLSLKIGSFDLLICDSKSSRLRFIGCVTKLTGG